jgi:hypothetical protein
VVLLGLRRRELADQDFAHLQQYEEHWAIVQTLILATLLIAGRLAAFAQSGYKQSVGTVTAAVETESHLFEAGLAEADAYTSALSAAATLAFATGQLGSAPR